mgnify:CR=1 FL=1
MANAARTKVCLACTECKQRNYNNMKNKKDVITMAEEKKVSDQKPNVFVRIGRWFKNLPGRIAKSFKNMAAELRLVSWPSKKKWIACSVTVLVFVLVMSIVIGALDMGATALVKLMM